MKSFPFFILLSFLFYFTDSFGQNIFFVDRQSTAHRIRFYEGKSIKFETNDHRKIIGKINYIGDSSLFVDEREYQIHSISGVYKTRKFFSYISTVGLLSAAAFLPANIITNSVNHRRIIGRDTYIIATGALGTLIVGRLFREKRMKIGAKYKLGIVNF